MHVVVALNWESSDKMQDNMQSEIIGRLIEIVICIYVTHKLQDMDQ